MTSGEQIPFPNFIPEQFTVNTPDEPIYDPRIHLNLERPEFIINLKFEKFFLQNFDADNKNDRERLNEFLKPG